jgi:hypothetical protein
VNISAAVMAHPKRKTEAEALWYKLTLYPFMEVVIIYDRLAAGTHQDEWRNGKQAMLAGVDKGDWHVVIQDDAILTPNFYENIVGAIENVPTKSLISLYTGKPRPLGKRVETAVNKVKDESWLCYWLLMWGVGLLIPSSHIEPMIEFVNDRSEPYDTRVGIFYQRNMLPVYYTMPSLVDHNDNLGSLLEHGKAEGARVAHRLATGRITWNKQVINI